jgi:hypothetical protein
MKRTTIVNGKLLPEAVAEVERLRRRQQQLREQADAMTRQWERIAFCPHGCDLSNGSQCLNCVEDAKPGEPPARPALPA